MMLTMPQGVNGYWIKAYRNLTSVGRGVDICIRAMADERHRP